MSSGIWGSESEEVLINRFPLHKACRDGDPVSLSRLVSEASHDQLVAEDQFYFWTPIHWSAYFGKNDCLNGLLHCGVNVNIKTSKFQQTPAHIAAFGGHAPTLHELMKNGADFHARDYLGEIPLHKAARVGNVECLQVLIIHGTCVNICNNNGLTACHIARNQHFSECVRLLETAEQEQMSDSHLNSSFNQSPVKGMSGAHMVNANGHSNGFNGHSTNGHCNGLNRKRAIEDISIPPFKKPKVDGCPCSMQSVGVVAAIRHPSQKPCGSELSSSSMEYFDVNETAMKEEQQLESIPNSSHLTYTENSYNGTFYTQYLIERQLEMYHASSNPSFACTDNSTWNSSFENSKSSIILCHSPSLTDDEETIHSVMECQNLNDQPEFFRKLESEPEDLIYRAPSPGMDMNWGMIDSNDIQLWGHMQGFGDTAETMPNDDLLLQPDENDREKSYCPPLRGVHLRGWR